MAAIAQKFDYFLVLDFEATCNDVVKLEPQEIIEFPCLKLNAKTLEIESEFHEYVRPTANPCLTKFCTELTGITQDLVDGQKCFSEVWSGFQQWLVDENLSETGSSFAFVTCGDWDLQSMLPRQCDQLGLPVPEACARWINIKKVFKTATRRNACGMLYMLKHFGITLEGRHHSGIDDSRNIARILRHILTTSSIELDNTGHRIIPETSSPKMAAASQKFDYFLVLDFEATCDVTKLEPQEIIEFPCLKLNAKTLEVESEFHKYVRPTANPCLTTFCTELTGIRQLPQSNKSNEKYTSMCCSIEDMVDGQKSFSEIWPEFLQWLSDENLGETDGTSFAFVTCGDWDLKSMLARQCKQLDLSIPDSCARWINIKKVYQTATGRRAGGMVHMLRHFGLSLEGRHHSGIDDSRNIARILKHILATCSIVLDNTMVILRNIEQPKMFRNKLHC